MKIEDSLTMTEAELHRKIHAQAQAIVEMETVLGDLEPFLIRQTPYSASLILDQLKDASNWLQTLSGCLLPITPNLKAK